MKIFDKNQQTDKPGRYIHCSDFKELLAQFLTSAAKEH